MLVAESAIPNAKVDFANYNIFFQGHSKSGVTSLKCNCSINADNLFLSSGIHNLRAAESES